MSVVNVFGKGGSTYGKHSSRLNFISDRIDRRLKENAAYRSSKPREGELIKEDGETFILFADGEKVKSNINLK
ncbi:MAG: hypothetical protein ACOCVB_01800 [Bacillota bacterium]